MQPALQRLPGAYCDYLVLLPEDPPVLLPEPELDPVPVLPEPVLLPEPMLPELEPPGALLPGVEVVLPDVPPELAPPVLPLELLPLVTPWSLRHFSRSLPVMPRHLLLLLPLAPEDDAPPEALLSDEPLELPPVALGVLLLELPLALGVLLELLPPAELPPVALGLLVDELPPVEPLPVALGVLEPAELPPALPADEPELCANEAPAIAKSAAVVAVTTSFIFTV
jgi:hypothetical protein